ncbi:MAG TPA: hypothetical protein VMF13_08630 [Luteitalea sp.]|nr:hypothetical protein [Luteitalea sp.]
MNHADITSAAHLLRFALTPKERPVGDNSYRTLMDRYLTDGEFAEIVARMADGLGLLIREATPLGLLVAGTADGPFVVTLDNCGLPIRSTGKEKLEDRRCFGLALVGLAAYAYPGGEALSDTASPTVRARELERFISAHAGTVIESAENSEDEQEQQLCEAARTWLDLPEVLPGGRGGGLRRGCRQDYINRTLDFLVAQGRARRESVLDDERGAAYALNDRFRIGIGEAAETVVFTVFAAARATEES